MKNKALFTDKMTGQLSIAEGSNRYFKTKDSASKSGHSLITQIDMTHSGIVTHNYGFYLPNRMKDGAKTFTQDYFKPVIVGHDEKEGEQAEPVGRVIQADYISNTDKLVQKDSYLKGLVSFMDAKQGQKVGKDLELVNYVIQQYNGRDDYRGLGHIRGTFKITDEAAIQKILDERYMTVSTSMASTSARCNVCGTDWVSEGQCEHRRGGVYEDKVMVLVPGPMFYDHVGIVNNPADPFAAGFKVIGQHQVTDSKDDSIELYEVKDSFSVAASAFAWNDKSLYSLSTKEDVDLIEVKDNIQKMENAMAKKKDDKELRQQILDGVRVSVGAYSYGEGLENKEMSISQYAETLSEINLEKLITDIQSVLKAEDSVEDGIIKYFDANFKPAKKKGEEEEEEDKEGKKTPKKEEKPAAKKAKKTAKKMDSFKLVEGDEVTEEKITEAFTALRADETLKDSTDQEVKTLAEVSCLIEAGCVITKLNYGDKFDAVAALAILKDEEKPELDSLSEESFLDMLNKHLPEDKPHSNEGLKSTDFCGLKGFFPVTDKDTYIASKATLAKISASDSVKGRILSAIEKKADKLKIDVSDSFDSNNVPCDNKEVSTEELVKIYEDARQKLIEKGHEFNDHVVRDSSADQEIAILEAQLEAANEEVESITSELIEVKDSLTETLATRLVDLKIISGSFEVADRDTAIADLKQRSLVSLKDSISDLASQIDLTKFKINDGIANKDVAAKEGKIGDPTLPVDKAAKTATSKDGAFQKEEIYDQYMNYARKYGKKQADVWLDSVQKKNGIKPSLD